MASRMNKKWINVLCILLMIGVVSYVFYSSCAEGMEEKVPHAPLRCGVDLPSCSGEHVRCVNGYCRSDVAPVLSPLSDLPITPPTVY